MADEGDPWSDLKPASYQIEGEIELKFMVLTVKEEGGLRMPRRPRPYRKAEKLDCTGPKSDEWPIEAVFHNDLTEPSLGDYPQIWPDRLERLIAAFKTGKTGWLNLPWKRNLRVKPESWSRSAAAEQHRGGELLSVKFVEDNEDNLDESAVELASVKATILGGVEDATFDLEREGLFDGSFEDLTELAADLEGALNAPGEFLQDVEQKALRLARAAQAMKDAFSSKLPGRNGLNDPAGANAARKLDDIIDAAGRAAGEAAARRPRTVGRTFPTARDLFDIAAELGQDARELLAVNTKLEDPSFIPAGTTVLVFAG